MTPWQKVATKFGWVPDARPVRGQGVQTALARIIGVHRSSVSRYLADPDGVIEGPHQMALITAAREQGIALDSSDFVADQAIEGLTHDQGDGQDKSRAAKAPRKRRDVSRAG